MFLIYTCGGDEGLYYSRNAVGLPRNRRDGYTYGTGPCGCGRWQCSTLYGVALCGCGRRWPRGGDGGWAGGAGGSCLSRGATGTLTVYCSQARCPLPGYLLIPQQTAAGSGRAPHARRSPCRLAPRPRTPHRPLLPRPPAHILYFLNTICTVHIYIGGRPALTLPYFPPPPRLPPSPRLPQQALRQTGRGASPP